MEQESAIHAPGFHRCAGKRTTSQLPHEPLGAALARRKKRPKSGRILLPEAADEDCNTKTWSKRTIWRRRPRLNPEAQGGPRYHPETHHLARASAICKSGKHISIPRTGGGGEGRVDRAAGLRKSAAGSPRGHRQFRVLRPGREFISLRRLIDKWVWATFELQNDVTNPQRCVVLECRDKWGSNPATTSGAATQLTPSLSDLMTQANLAPEWKNYRLDGVQIDYLDADGKPDQARQFHH